MNRYYSLSFRSYFLGLYCSISQFFNSTPFLLTMVMTDDDDNVDVDVDDDDDDDDDDEDDSVVAYLRYNVLSFVLFY
jgi:hypothetical protein